MAALLSRTFAPVLRALGAHRQKSSEGESPTAQREQETSQAQHVLPQIEYPSPLVIRNTFIDVEIKRPVSLDEFYDERIIRSTPASAIDMTWRVFGEPEAGEMAKHRPGRSLAQDGSSSCRSTSVGSSSARSSADDSPSALTEASPTDASECTRRQASPTSHNARCLEGLPEIEYPAPIFVRNTFIDAGIGRPVSLDGFYEERRLQSCPASAVHKLTDSNEEDGLGALAIPMTEAARMGESLPLGVPPPPAMPPVLPASLYVPDAPPQAPTIQDASTLPAPSTAPKAALLLLSDVLDAPLVGSPVHPTVGSADHYLGTCRPCAHAHSAKSCMNGVQCPFCHLCPPGELKRQQKAKRRAQRNAVAA
mmetsp:Transcript_18505/g.38480  ORF Transcript_18505/g.38480 Transcript_18505/m.38480 type:complete len:365 (-) Transcript_18505:341-1435(-)